MSAVKALFRTLIFVLTLIIFRFFVFVRCESVVLVLDFFLTRGAAAPFFRPLISRILRIFSLSLAPVVGKQ